MRIIAGQARGRRLATLKGEDTRPTLERVKEAMFSAVQFWLPGASVLDLYAGSGQLGLEALSRGAARCVLVDNSAEAVALIAQNAAAAGLADKARVLRADAAAYLARCGERFDLILLDPPYRRQSLPDILPMAAKVAAPGALVLCESEPGAPLPAQAGGLRLEKQYRYGAVLVSRYKNLEDPDA